ncbi:dihydrofolate reductase family protein [Streptomyces sp. NPDC006645]|uniref:dihydrofolate reductase family protein n=1 Tax=Streptomyces sp. NPDC006645 TaxID=3157184 RepID=UPI0033A00AD1
MYGVKRLMVEGGGTIHTQLLEAALADELQLVIAPLLVGQPDAVRMLGPADDARLTTATIYSYLEPCAKRASRPRPCAQLIRDSGLRRVVTAWSEPDTFVAGADGTELLEDAGVTVVSLPEYANVAQALHLL